MRPHEVLLLSEPPLLVRRRLAVLLGLNEALVLQQLQFVLTHVDSRAVELEGERWVRAPLDYWRVQFPFFSESTIKRSFASLREKRVVRTERGREANVYTIDYAALDAFAEAAHVDLSPRSDRPEHQGQDDPAPSMGERTTESGKKEDVAATSAASSDAPALPGLEPPPVATEPESEDEGVQEVWDHYLSTFGDRIRSRDLSDPRRRDIRKALKAVGGDVALCQRAISGLKSYRAANPHGSKDVSISVVFATGPHSTRNLTDQIEWWATQVDDPAHGTAVPSVTHERVARRRVAVVEMHADPGSTAARERGSEAEEWLRAHAKEEAVVEDGRVTGWRALT